MFGPAPGVPTGLFGSHGCTATCSCRTAGEALLTSVQRLTSVHRGAAAAPSMVLRVVLPALSRVWVPCQMVQDSPGFSPPPFFPHPPAPW